MTDTATQTGVVDSDTSADDLENQQNQGTEDAERPLSAREQAMEEIHAKRRAEIDAEIREDGGAGIDDQIAAQTASDEPPPPPPPASTVRVKIDGEESEVPLDELVRSYQKGAAADKRLEEASRLLREAKEANERATQISRQTTDDDTPRVTTARTTQDDGGSPEVGELHKKFVASLYEGDDDTSAKLLDDLVEAKLRTRTGEGRQTATPTREELVAEVKKQLDEDSAFERFSTTFNDIWGDPYLASIADSYLAAETKAGKALGEALMESGRKTRDWMRSKGMKVPDEAKQTADLTTRLERKASVTTLPAASVRASSPPPEAPSVASTIAEMRRARGQA